MKMRPYITALKQRIKHKNRMLTVKYNKTLKLAGLSAKLLAIKFNVNRVYLFGSLLEKESFNDRSDIDIAVIGLKPDKYIQAISVLNKKLNYEINVVMLETCAKSLQHKVLTEGKLLYASN
jgi:predicted nucleotidyltransferase